MIPAWLSFTLATFLYLLVPAGIAPKPLEDLDHFIQGPGHSLLRDRWKPSWTAALRSIIVTLSDQHLVVATAIQVTATARHCDGTQYHTTIATYLGFVASNTHDACITVVEDELLSDAAMRYWRLAWMAWLDIILIATTVLIGGSKWLGAFGLPSQCGWADWGQIDPGLPTIQVAFPLVLIAWSLCNIGMLVLKPLLTTESRAYKWITVGPAYWKSWSDSADRKVANALKRHTAASPDWSLWIYTSSWLIYLNGMRLGYIVIHSLIGVATSGCLNLSRCGIALGLLTNAVMELRRSAYDNGLEGNEDDWGFGQILPLTLLALPLFQLIEYLTSSKSGMDQD